MKQKTYLKFILVFALILGLFSQYPEIKADAASKTYSATVNVSALNVREKPSTKSKKVGSLKKGTKVTVYSKTKSGWSEIRYKKKRAYVSTKYLKFATDSTSWNGIYSYYYKDKKSVAELSRVLKITKQTKDKFQFALDVSSTNSNGSTHVGFVEGTATYKGTTAKVNIKEDDYSCKLTMTRTKTGVSVKEIDCLAFHGAAVDFNGSYKK